MRKEQIAQLAATENREGLGQHLAVYLVAAGIEDHPGIRVDDDVLVGLHRESAGVEILQKDVAVDAVIIEDDV